jgi:hypothetical protein
MCPSCWPARLRTGAEWRARVEALDALEAAGPQDGGCGDDWSSSLRNAHEKFVQVLQGPCRLFSA